MPFTIIEDKNSYESTESPFVSVDNGQFRGPELKEEWDYEYAPDDSFDAELFNEKQGELIGVTPSRFTEFAVMMPNKEKNIYEPFSFAERRYLKPIYDTPSKRTLLKFGRQSEKSTMLGNKLLSYSCINTAMNSLYVSPTNMQAKVFSQDRLAEPMATSNYLKSWTTTKLSDSVFLKKFINRSQITLRYAYLNADRCRGIPADCISLDEIQDILTDNIPVIEECASHSTLTIGGEVHRGGIFMYSGTPKSLDNTLEKYWSEQSTQNEWVVPCHRHSIQTPGGPVTKIYWNVLTEDHIGKDSLVCEKCNKPIYPMDPDSKWVSMNAKILKSETIKKPFEGFHVSQLMVPWIKHNDILQKQATYSRDKFYNEVLGESYDSGTRPLTRQDIIDNCDPRLLLTPEYQEYLLKFLGAAFPVYAGIDWSGGCHDEETRILTDKGFIHFRDLQNDNKVAQWDPETREMSFALPLDIQVKEWDRPLLHFKGKGLDLMVTEDHRILNKTRLNKNSKWVTQNADIVASKCKNKSFVGYVNWKGKDESIFILPGLPISSGYSGSSDLRLSMDLWLEWLGYYLSEGGLCFDGTRPSCIKMSQRETVNRDKVIKIRECLNKLGLKVSEFPNPKTGDINWTIYGKQLWKWVQDNVGSYCSTKRIPRQFLNLPKRQLKILFDAMMLGDGSYDKRKNNTGGKYISTSKGLCEDFQEICIKLGLKSTLSVEHSEVGNHKALWRLCFSKGRDVRMSKAVEKIQYNGKVYCCSVPTGFIVTERNGCISYQGNSGGSYTVLSLGAYMGDSRFTIFYVHRFEGKESEPQIQIEEISRIINKFRVQLVGCDYGGGFWPNDELTRRFGFQRIPKYQYAQISTKVMWQDGLKRFLVHRTEVMSDIFNAIKRRNIFRFPNWEQFQSPFGEDCLNIFSEYNEQIRQNVYKKSPNCTDDTFHSIVLCFLASMIRNPRPDIVAPTANAGRTPKPNR